MISVPYIFLPQGMAAYQFQRQKQQTASQVSRRHNRQAANAKVTHQTKWNSKEAKTITKTANAAKLI